MSQMPRLVSLLLMAALIAALGATFIHVMAPFLMPLFLAGVFAILSQPIYKRILLRTGDRPTLAAALTTAAVLTIVFVPLTVGTFSAAMQLKRLAEDHNWRKELTAMSESKTVQGWVQWYGEKTGDPVDIGAIERDLGERLQEAGEKLREVATALVRKTLGSAGSTLSLLGSVAAALIGTLTFVLAFFYFLADGPALIEATVNLIPVHREYQRRLIAQFDQAVRAVVTATFAAAIGQGIATGAGMYVAGFHHFFIVTFLATLTALVPLLGTWLVWGPYVLWLVSHESPVAAGALALYSIIVVGLFDNVIRTYVLQSNVKLHPLLAFVSVLGGIQVLGLWGLFVGPIVASCLHGLLKIFNSELLAFSRERQSREPSAAEESTVVLRSDELRGPPAPRVVPAAGHFVPDVKSAPAAEATADTRLPAAIPSSTTTQPPPASASPAPPAASRRP